MIGLRMDAADSAPTFYEQLAALEREGVGFVLVILADSLGSTPQDTGAKMIVSTSGLLAGTVGGGKVEAKAIELAAALLNQSGSKPRFVNWSLKGDVGMTCGGSVKLYFEPHPAGGLGASWPIWIFGAGHVVQALVPVLVPLPCALTVCDSRREWLDRLPRARNIRFECAAEPASLVPSIPDNAFVLCLTKGHATDRPVLQRALGERNFPFVGVIGSDAKARILRRELIAGGLSAKQAARFHCPVGLPFGTNHPHEIALSIAAQLVTERDRRSGSRSDK
ncbi:MAG TPA: xanthine dehydrogenase accessory protein XdhC [Candidatus Didemnitutus sp.]|nr:xanthine dehydrogenase accessory protein XdhC [Candidatus Didemnitutus sp.]